MFFLKFSFLLSEGLTPGIEDKGVNIFPKVKKVKRCKKGTMKKLGGQETMQREGKYSLLEL